MGFSDDALKIWNDVSGTVGEAAGSAGEEINQRIDLRFLQQLGEEIGKHVGATADDVWKALLGAGEDIGKHAGPMIGDVGKAFDGYGKEVGKHLAGALEAGQKIEWERLPVEMKDWIEKHPVQTMGIVIGLLAAPLAVASVPAVLSAIGFTADGVALGSVAAGIQAGIGDVAAHSLFATLMSAGAGGAGLATVQAVVGSVVGAAGIGMNIPGLMRLPQEGDKKHKEKAKL